jgi:hypothetical protein
MAPETKKYIKSPKNVINFPTTVTQNTSEFFLPVTEKKHFFYFVLCSIAAIVGIRIQHIWSNKE